MTDLFGNMFGGAGYAAQRARGTANLASVKPGETKSGLQKAAEWRAEVQVFSDQGMKLREALQMASQARKMNPGYRTIKERTIDGYTGRNPSRVQCLKPMKGFAAGDCPAKRRTVAPSTKFRPGAHYKRVMTQETAAKLLRDHYRTRGLAQAARRGVEPKVGLKWATASMRKDISRTRKDPLTPCPTKTITYLRGGKQITRKVVQKTAACADSWLYRGNGSRLHDMTGVDHGTGKGSLAYGKRTLRAGGPRVPRA